MFYYRITKYNPKFRDADGRYMRDEWTSYSDIGCVYNKQLFTLEEYIKVERVYCEAINSFMDCLKVTHCYVQSLEKNIPNNVLNDYSIDIVNMIESLQEGMFIDKNTIISIVPLILREIIWCKLESEKMYVHFGYDYYMYIGSQYACLNVIQHIQDLGLFVEICESPYL